MTADIRRWLLAGLIVVASVALALLVKAASDDLGDITVWDAQ